MKNIITFMQNHINFGVQNVTVISVVVALLIFPSVMFLPARCGWENGLLENIQMLVLFLGVGFSLRAKVDKKFFLFIALFLLILILREINCGRTLFFAVPGTENTFYRWSEIKYGYLAHPLYGFFMACVGVYFLKNKLFINLWQKIKNIKFPIWNFLLLLLGMVGGIYAEECAHNFLLEESTELLFYTALVGFIYLYSQHKDFISGQKD